MLHDLHQCHSSKETINGKKKRIERCVSTIAYNLSYRLQRHKKKVLEADNRYPQGTFFVITENGKHPELNKHLKRQTL
jgi:hypothetical protein